MSQRVIVLGGGLVGATMARDLAREPGFAVTLADVNPDVLARATTGTAITPRQADLSAPEQVRRLVADFDLVVGAMPSALAFQTLHAVIESHRPYSDIAFMPEDALALHELALRHGTTAVVDCGVAPGLSNMIVGHHAARLEQVESVEIYVGGLPKEPRWPYQYKAPFAPSDVIEEYTRPARLVENGQVVTRPALSEPELLNFPYAGTLEAFNTDGLRSLIRTVHARNMREKTLRYPGHIELMRVLRETGFFDKVEIDVKGVSIRPLDVTARLLFPFWQLEEAEPEFTVMRVIVAGRDDERLVRYVYDLYDEYNAEDGATSMARTTGYTNTIVARMLAAGRFREPGVFAPEQLAARDGVLEHVLGELRQRGVRITASQE